MSELWADVPDAVTVRAPAKINLHLGVQPVQEDGYHLLDTIYQAIGLYDDVTVSSADDWMVEVESTADVDISQVPLDESNLAVRAGKLLQAHHGLVESGARIEIAKGIPVAGGLAGGSADAAATLVGLDRLWNLETSDEDLLAIAAELGSDVPFALIGGTAHGSGHGEVVSPSLDTGNYWWVLVPHGDGLSTPAVYAEFDRQGNSRANPGTDALFDALHAGSATELGAALWNDLEEPAQRLRPELTDRLVAVSQTTALGHLLSGSGPTVLGLARDAEHAREIIEQLRSHGIEQTLAAPGPVAGTHVVTYA